MNESLIMLHKLKQLDDVYKWLLVSLSDTEEHNKLLESLLEIVEDLESEFEEPLNM